MINTYLSEEEIEFHCGHCKMKTQANKKVSFTDLPDNFILQFNRFHYDGGSVKTFEKIEVELELAIPINNQKLSYELLALIVHKVTLSTTTLRAALRKSVTTTLSEETSKGRRMSGSYSMIMISKQYGTRTRHNSTTNFGKKTNTFLHSISGTTTPYLFFYRKLS
jgi:ubiquitin C-terminal hydrolase